MDKYTTWINDKQVVGKSLVAGLGLVLLYLAYKVCVYYYFEWALP